MQWRRELRSVLNNQGKKSSLTYKRLPVPASDVATRRCFQINNVVIKIIVFDIELGNNKHLLPSLCANINIPRLKMMVLVHPIGFFIGSMTELNGQTLNLMSKFF